MKVDLDILPGVWVVVDLNSRYTYYNDAYSIMMGLPPSDRSMIGKTIADIPNMQRSPPETYWKTDLIVQEEKRTLKILNIIKYGDTWRYLQINKQPCFDEDGNVEKIIYHFIDHSEVNLVDLGLVFTLNKNLLDNLEDGYIRLSDHKGQQDLQLSKKEAECLFFIIRGLNYKEIARIQNVAYSTICDHANRLKSKFKVTSKSELIAKAVLCKLPKGLPQDIFKTPISILID